MGPPSVEVDVGLLQGTMAEKQPEPKDWLGQDIEDGVNHDLGVNRRLMRAIDHTPDTIALVSVENRNVLSDPTHIG